MVLSSYALCIVQLADGVGSDGDSLDDAALSAGIFGFDSGTDLAGDGFGGRHDGLNSDWAGSLYLAGQEQQRLCLHQAQATKVDLRPQSEKVCLNRRKRGVRRER